MKQFLLKFTTYTVAESFKTLIAGVLYYSGLAWALSLFKRRGAMILIYHSVGVNDVFWDNKMPPAVFEEQVAYLTSRYRVVPLSAIVQRLRAGAAVPADWVAITFDDGYKDNVDTALPILRKYGAAGAFFVTVGVVNGTLPFFYDAAQTVVERTDVQSVALSANGKEVRYDLSTTSKRQDAILRMVLSVRSKGEAERHAFVRELAERCRVQPKVDHVYLDPSDLKRLTEGGAEVGSHTLTHANLNALSDAELARELEESKRFVEAASGRPVTGLAYPFGKPWSYSDRVKAAVRKSGYEYALSTRYGKVRSGDDLLDLPRIAARNAALCRLKVNLLGTHI